MRKIEGVVKEIVDELEYLKRRELRFQSTNGASAPAPRPLVARPPPSPPSRIVHTRLACPRPLQLPRVLARSQGGRAAPLASPLYCARPRLA